MKRLLFVAAILFVALILKSPQSAAAADCYEENYGSGTCATTCVKYNDQGSVVGWRTVLHQC
jgi:hypothetical protein